MFNQFVMNGLPHDKIRTDHFYIRLFIKLFSIWKFTLGYMKQINCSMNLCLLVYVITT
jgi:hypothetical protein